jgi:predicted ester cyclase
MGSAERLMAAMTAAYDGDDWEAYRQQYADQAVLHSADGDLRGGDEIVAYDRRVKKALAASVERDLFVAGDGWAAWRWRLSGRHRGEFGGLAATGREIDFTGATIARLGNEVICELWTFPDRLAFLRQVGAI